MYSKHCRPGQESSTTIVTTGVTYSSFSPPIQTVWGWIVSTLDLYIRRYRSMVWTLQNSHHLNFIQRWPVSDSTFEQSMLFSSCSDNLCPKQDSTPLLTTVVWNWENKNVPKLYKLWTVTKMLVLFSIQDQVRKKRKQICTRFHTWWLSILVGLTKQDGWVTGLFWWQAIICK